MRRALLAGIMAVLVIPAAAHAQFGDRLRINGYSSMEFEYMMSDEGRGDPNGSFDADLFDLVINFRPVDRLRVAADITWEHGAASEDGMGNVAVEYAFAEYAFNDWARIRAGKQFIHFGIYNEIHTAKPSFLTVKEPLSTNKNYKFGSEFRFYPRWGAGVAATGSGLIGDAEVDYVVQLTNGHQDDGNPYEEDDNSAKALSGIVRVRPTPDIRVGASFYRDALAEFDDEGEDLGTNTAIFTYGAFVEWTGPVGIEFEYVAGSASPTGQDQINRHAYTLMFFKPIGRLTPYARYEWLDPNKDLEDDVATLVVTGVNFRLAPGLHLKAELDSFYSDAANDRFKGRNYREIKAAVAVAF